MKTKKASRLDLLIRVLTSPSDSLGIKKQVVGNVAKAGLATVKDVGKKAKDILKATLAKKAMKSETSGIHDKKGQPESTSIGIKDRVLAAAVTSLGAGAAERSFGNKIRRFLMGAMDNAKDLTLSDLDKIQSGLAATGKNPSIHTLKGIRKHVAFGNSEKGKKIVDEILKANPLIIHGKDLIIKRRGKKFYDELMKALRPAARRTLSRAAIRNIPFTAAMGKTPFIGHSKNLSQLLHEVGHIKNPDILNALGMFIPSRKIGKAGRIMAPLAGKAGLGAYSELIASVPRLTDEALASLRATLWTAKNKGLKPALKTGLNLSKAFGTYLTGPILALLGAKLGLYAKDKAIEYMDDKTAAFITGFKKVAVKMMLHSNPQKPQKDLVTPKINTGNKKVREGVKTNMKHLEQVTYKKKLPQAQFQTKTALIAGFAAGASKLMSGASKLYGGVASAAAKYAPVGVKKLWNKSVSSALGGIGLGGPMGRVSNEALRISARATAMPVAQRAAYLKSMQGTTRRLGSMYKGLAKAKPPWLKRMTFGDAAVYGGFSYGLSKVTG